MHLVEFGNDLSQSYESKGYNHTTLETNHTGSANGNPCLYSFGSPRLVSLISSYQVLVGKSTSTSLLLLLTEFNSALNIDDNKQLCQHDPVYVGLQVLVSVTGIAHRTHR